MTSLLGELTQACTKLTGVEYLHRKFGVDENTGYQLYTLRGSQEGAIRVHGKIFSLTRFVNGVEEETSGSPKRASTLRRSTSARSEEGSFSSAWDRPKCWARAKGGSVILERFLPGGSIVVHTSKASFWTVLK